MTFILGCGLALSLLKEERAVEDKFKKLSREGVHNDNPKEVTDQQPEHNQESPRRHERSHSG